MNEVMIGILVPFLGTSLGSACVFFMKKNMSDYLQRALTGFADGSKLGGRDVNLESVAPGN